MAKPEFWVDDETAAGADGFWLYCIAELGCEESGPCKVGIATSIAKRLSSLQCGNWRRLCVVWKINLHSRDTAKTIEQYCLNRLRPSIYGDSTEDRLQSEWVNHPPKSVFEAALTYLDALDHSIRRVA